MLLLGVGFPEVFDKRNKLLFTLGSGVSLRETFYYDPSRVTVPLSLSAGKMVMSELDLRFRKKLLSFLDILNAAGFTGREHLAGFQSD